ncbi:MAG: hypothetical protein UV78_C0010G0034 [Parcubacteria group bacterium GW2011_GWA2_43_17]|nr:MAG: hypothetical protein UV78_C0010G0034 [Parcubacteria group bacterium GW2011_GWA2_43_17]
MSPHGYQELSRISPSYARVRGRLPMCYSPVCHAATVATGLKPVATVAAFDLHALDTPPAFILSQDQTLIYDKAFL